jgi:hypothetical protein
MKKTLNLLLLVAGLLTAGAAFAQSLYTVQYMVTYDAALQKYTAWVVPQYATPNSHNPEVDEYGSTAQFSLKIPRNAVVSDIQDKVGVWDKKPRKIGTEPIFTKAGVDPFFAYYVVGKTPSHTKYGAFAVGNPIALFSFKCAGATPAQVQPMTSEDSFVGLANKTLSLNVGSSFYSTSGQPSVATARPLEQFNGAITPLEMMKQLQNSLDATQTGLTAEDHTPLLIYPNPTSDEVQVKIFSEQSTHPLELTVIDGQGIRQRLHKSVLSSGMNSIKMNLADLPGGTYYVKTLLDGKTVVKTLKKM